MKWAFNTQHSYSSWSQNNTFIYKSWSSQYLLCNQRCSNTSSPYIVRTCRLLKGDMYWWVKTPSRICAHLRMTKHICELSRRISQKESPPCRIIWTAPGRFSGKCQIIFIHPPFPQGGKKTNVSVSLYISEDFSTLL